MDLSFPPLTGRTMTDPGTHALPFRLIRPEPPLAPVIFASPHSGREYPAEMLARSDLDGLKLRSSEDAFVDDLLSAVPAQGAALLLARLPRAYVDLNRAEDELDPALIEGLAPRAVRNPRVAAGLGVIPRVVSGGRAIQPGKIPLAEAEARLAAVWRPYHAALGALIADTRLRFGHALVLDMHSMPSDAVSVMGAGRPQIVLGDRFGTSAGRATVARIEACFLAEGLRVQRNAPFAGAYVARHYGRPAENVEVVQIEIDRSLYMDEARIVRSSDFTRFAATMGRIVARLARIGRGREDGLAAE